MKIRLLNNGGYYALENVDFPVIVNGIKYKGSPLLILVSDSEMNRIGGLDWFEKNATNDAGWAFEVGKECEVIDAD